MSDTISLPTINSSFLPLINNITDSLGVPRTVLANDEEIQYAWNNLPREIRKIPSEYRDELLVKMCVATSVGLFDGAINYVWNASIRHLRRTVSYFGLNVVAQILNSPFDENKLNDLKDAELLSLCLKLNLISEEGYFFLNQCRDIRNNFSAAHPTIGSIDDTELINFISRCGKHAFSNTINPKGVDINLFISKVKDQKFNELQLETWSQSLTETHDAQRELLFDMLHGLYCDPSSNEETRINSLKVCGNLVELFTPSVKSNLLNRHYSYKAKGDLNRHKASQIFLEKLDLLSLLNDGEFHTIISNVCKNLMSIHLGYDNFYNEPPFAQRLCELSDKNEIPNTAKQEYVTTVLSCFVGNQYGVSRTAIPYYTKMIKNFSPLEISIMFEKTNNTLLANRLANYSNCRVRYKEAVTLLNVESIPTKLKKSYDEMMS